MSRSREQVRSYRDELHARMSARYNGWRHLVGISVLAAAATLAALWLVESFEWLELLAIPVTWVAANLAEYAVHRGPLHSKTRFLGKLYDIHAGEHHLYFSHELMACDDHRGLRVTVFPLSVALMFLVGVGGTFGAVGWLLFGPDVGLLAYAAVASYYLAYEWLHTGSHMPADSVIGRMPGVAYVRRLHGVHHEPAKMRTTNFNFMAPLGDWLFGTWER